MGNHQLLLGMLRKKGISKEIQGVVAAVLDSRVRVPNPVGNGTIPRMVGRCGEVFELCNMGIDMRTLTVRKVGETEKAAQYCVTFWIVENPGHPVCGDGKEFFFNRWLPKRVVTPIDDTHIGIPKKFLEETLKILADKHPFQEVRYSAQFYPERFKWSVETISGKS